MRFRNKPRRVPFMGRPHVRPSRSRKILRWVVLLVGLGCILGGIYTLTLIMAPNKSLPNISSPIDLNTADDATDSRERIQIEKINLEVPIFTGDASALDKGVWHRYPERGNPEKGGNFILSAHRFDIGTTPAETKKRSPFYNIDKLKVGDGFRVFYAGKWYDYTVTKTFSVKPNAVEIEAPSSEAKLTLYTCSLAGSADGRVVIEAKLK